MIITGDCEIHRFAIKKLAKEIDKQIADWKHEEEIKLRYRTVRKAWGWLLSEHNIDDTELYRLMCKLEYIYYKEI